MSGSSRALIALLVAALALGGCKKTQRDDDEAPVAEDDQVKPRTRALIEDLRAGGERAWRATDHLHKLSTQQALTTADGEAILDELSTLPAPGDDEDEVDLQRGVLFALAQYLIWDWIPTLERIVGDLREDGRLALLEVFANIDDPHTMEAFVRVLDRYPTPVPDVAFDNLQGEPHQGEAAFPALFVLIDRHPDLAFEIAYTAHEYAVAGAMPAGAIAGYAGRWIEWYDEALSVIAPAQRAQGIDWMFDEVYAEARIEAGVLLGLLRFAPAELVADRFAEAMRLRDPRLVAYGIEGWLALGRTPPAVALERAAASHEARWLLWGTLQKADRLDLMPARWNTQEHLAASVLTWWLITQSEYARAPDEIALLDKVSFDGGPPYGMLDIYVFRFRSGDDEWLAGSAGEFVRADGLSIADHGATGSELRTVDGRTAAEIMPPDYQLTLWRERAAAE